MSSISDSSIASRRHTQSSQQDQPQKNQRQQEFDARRQRRQGRSNKNDAQQQQKQPIKIVCTKSQLLRHKHNAIELGAIFSLGIVALFLFGFINSFLSLPMIHTERYIGANLNLPVLEKVLNDDDTPYATWPVSIRNENNLQTEMIYHPGDNVTKMIVPKFWSKPLHHQSSSSSRSQNQHHAVPGGDDDDNDVNSIQKNHNEEMIDEYYSREEAMQVGTCAKPDLQKVDRQHVRGDECPLNERTIYIAIASYRDFQCRKTVESIFNRAAYPHRLRIGIVDQIVKGEDPVCNEPIQPCNSHPHQAICQYADQIDIYKMDAQLSVGPVFARHIGHRMYRGEYYATQSDAHVTFTQNWDVDIIEQLESTHNEMAVLSTYLSDVQGSIDPVTGKSLVRTRPIMCNTVYEETKQGIYLRHRSQPERVTDIHGSPQLQPWWAAGYSFSRGHFVVNVPYDQYQPMIFQGEEMSIGIRGFTIGYDYYAPERSVCFHHYAVGDNEEARKKVKHFWENGPRYEGVGVPAMDRLLGIVHMNPEIAVDSWDHTEEDVYGLGNSRTPEEFYDLFGIDVISKTIPANLCEFVSENGGQMHRHFTPFLRRDGMGIDYSQIDFRFTDAFPEK